jgi:hypothetical protein
MLIIAGKNLFLFWIYFFMEMEKGTCVALKNISTLKTNLCKINYWMVKILTSKCVRQFLFSKFYLLIYIFFHSVLYLPFLTLNNKSQHIKLKINRTILRILKVLLRIYFIVLIYNKLAIFSSCFKVVFHFTYYLGFFEHKNSLSAIQLQFMRKVFFWSNKDKK